jgi:hypothetical protein
MKSKPEKGDIVEINMDPTGLEFVPMRAKVIDLLAVQFTAEYPLTNALTFQFYRDEGSEWRKL